MLHPLMCTNAHEVSSGTRASSSRSHFSNITTSHHSGLTSTLVSGSSLNSHPRLSSVAAAASGAASGSTASSSRRASAAQAGIGMGTGAGMGTGGSSGQVGGSLSEAQQAELAPPPLGTLDDESRMLVWKVRAAGCMWWGRRGCACACSWGTVELIARYSSRWRASRRAPPRPCILRRRLRPAGTLHPPMPHHDGLCLPCHPNDCIYIHLGCRQSGLPGNPGWFPTS